MILFYFISMLTSFCSGLCYVKNKNSLNGATKNVVLIFSRVHRIDFLWSEYLIMEFTWILSDVILGHADITSSSSFPQA